MNRLRAFLAHNLLIKFISLILSVMLWAYVVAEETQEIQRNVELEILVPETMTVVSTSHDTVVATLRGTRSALDLLEANPVKGFYPVGDKVPAGQFVFEVTRRHIRTPNGVKVVGINPSVLTAVLDKLVTRRLPVKVDLVGHPAEGFKVAEERIHVNPNAALITGPEQVLSKLEYVLTQPLSSVGQTRPGATRPGVFRYWARRRRCRPA